MNPEEALRKIEKDAEKMVSLERRGYLVTGERKFAESRLALARALARITMYHRCPTKKSCPGCEAERALIEAAK